MANLARRRKEPADQIETISVGTDQAWKLFDVISILVRASEVKSSAALAADGIVAGVLYNVIKDEEPISLPVATLATICLAAVILSGFCVACALIPRLWVRGTPTNLIYFNHIARRFSNCDDYIKEFRRLVIDEHEIVTQIGAQTWANARIARRKFLWSAWAIILLFFALFALAITVFLAKL
jgi:hypothetical protein